MSRSVKVGLGGYNELDKWLAEKVMGWTVNTMDSGFTVWRDDKINTYSLLGWHPTENIKQAFECVDKMMQDGYWLRLTYRTIYTTTNGTWEALFRCIPGSSRPDRIDYADTPELAICHAIKTMGVPNDPNTLS